MGSVASSVSLLMSWLASNHGTKTSPRGGLLRSRVSTRVVDQKRHRVLVHFHAKLGGTLYHDLLNVVVGQRLQHEDATARKQRRYHFEAGILGGCTNQDNGSIFHVGQQKVLLCFIESVDLVQKHHGRERRSSLRIVHVEQITHRLTLAAQRIGELERAGAAAIQLEDQELPKRCGHLSGKSLVTVDSMCAKLRAAAAARLDDDTVIIARTDARGVESFEAAVDRSKRYVDAGADWIFPEALATREEFEAFANAVNVPLVANMTEFGKSPLLSLDELANLGYAGVIYPVTTLRIAMKAIEAALAVLDQEGTQAGLLDLMQTREELYELLGYDEYEKRDREYFGNNE